MRKRSKMLAIGGLVAIEMAAYYAPVVIASSPASARVEGSQNKPQIVALNPANPQAVQLPQVDKPDFDRQILTPLRASQAAQAQAEALARAKARRRVVKPRPVAVTVSAASGDAWHRLRLCESGGNYARNSGNGYYGAYQYNLSTWGNFGGYSRPDLAPPAVQDAKARETYARRGWRPWPACSRKLGLA